MSRIAKKFTDLRYQHRKALLPFIVAGHPSLAMTKRLMVALEAAGADLIEIGIPFSDPMADGPVIQKASEVALARGVTLAKILKLVREVRNRSEIPIVLMGYYNPILAYRLKRFAREAARAGVDGILVVDLPPEESGPLDRELKKWGIDLISLLTPTSNERRIHTVLRRARGFLYFVSMTGITGARLNRLSGIKASVQKIKRLTRLPVVVGFGIRNSKQVHEIYKFSDGVVIGSELVKRLSSGRFSLKKVTTFLKSCR